MSAPYSVELGPTTCAAGCRAVTYGQVCTDTPGIVHDTGAVVTLCSPGRRCDDAVVHRAEGTGWHTSAGVSADDWYAARGMGQGALDLGEVSG